MVTSPFSLCAFRMNIELLLTLPQLCGINEMRLDCALNCKSNQRTMIERLSSSWKDDRNFLVLN